MACGLGAWAGATSGLLQLTGTHVAVVWGQGEGAGTTNKLLQLTCALGFLQSFSQGIGINSS